MNFVGSPYPAFDLQFFAGEKTEPATERRLQDAHERGQTPKSTDLTAAVILAVIVTYFYYKGGLWVQEFLGYFRQVLVFYLNGGQEGFDLFGLYGRVMINTFKVLAPFLLLVMFVAVAINLYQVGFNFTTFPLEPDLEKLNPFVGMQNLLGWRAINELGKAMVKILMIAWIPYSVIRREAATILGLSRIEVNQGAHFIWTLLFEIFYKVVLILLVIAVADYLFQRWRFFENLKMSKDEIKDEYKMREGDPKIKQKIRERGRALLKRKMFQELPKADVVITNPTHLAIAIHYDPTSGHTAPRVIAKGSGFMAERIKAVAEQLGIMILENKPLAQALFKSTEIGDEIPNDLYLAVAEILKIVYRTKNRRGAA